MLSIVWFMEIFCVYFLSVWCLSVRPGWLFVGGPHTWPRVVWGFSTWSYLGYPSVGGIPVVFIEMPHLVLCGLAIRRIIWAIPVLYPPSPHSLWPSSSEVSGSNCCELSLSVVDSSMYS